MLSGIPDLNDEHRQLLQIVTRESERLNTIITDFLAYSRGRQYRFAKVDLLPLLEDTLTLLEHRLAAQNAGIRVERKYGVKEAWTSADGDKLKQVFWNFCENAVRAMTAGGTLTVALESTGEDWQINFADTGPGMSQQFIEKVFEPFQSQFEGGTGLGLAIVYQIVQAHEGKVWARSKLGQGSVFVLRLRCFAAGETGAAPQAGSAHQAHSALLDSPNVVAAATAGGGAHG
jgi:signal transduction histidine kinase